MGERAIMSALSYKPPSWSRLERRRLGRAAQRTRYGMIVAVNFTNGSLVLRLGGSEKNA
jgi:hypothetical protein